MKFTAKRWGIAYRITYEVPTASGNAAWHFTTAVGLKKLDVLELCKLHGYKVIRITRSPYFKYR